MAASRTGNALKNSLITIMCQAVYLLSGFVGRTVLTKTLGSEYLGINGLFSNVLTILSFAELGIGSTLVYRMYEPLASGNKEKLSAYIQLYKKMYSIIIVIILAAGVLVIPFLKYIVEAPNVEESLISLYLLYLADTIITYAYVYKKSILIADQKSYVVSIFTQILNVVMNIVQCVVLVITHNFILYMFVKIICNLLNNIFCSAYAEKRYPYIKDKFEVKLEKEDTDGLKNDIKGLLLTKVASTTFGGTDNIFISSFIGINFVGILSNYTMILDVINSLMNNVFGSITASIGNLNTSGDFNRTEKILYRMWFVNICIYGYISIGTIILIREFITEIWFDSKYYLTSSVIFMAVLELFLRGVHYPMNTVRTSLGLFSEYKLIFVAAAILNIILDFLLVRPYGIAGLYFATIICRSITYIVDIFTVYKIAFKKSVFIYFRKMIFWFVYLTVLYAILYYICKLITINGILGFGLKIIVITLCYAAATILIFRKNDDFIYFRNMVLNFKEKLRGCKQ